jgi:hypothetical protein
MKRSADAIKVAEHSVQRRIGAGEQILRCRLPSTLFGVVRLRRRLPVATKRRLRDARYQDDAEFGSPAGDRPGSYNTDCVSASSTALANVLDKLDRAVIVTSASARPIGVTFVARAGSSPTLGEYEF